MTISAQAAADLLGRPVRPMQAPLSVLRGRRIMITGAAGSIGRALALRLAQCAPRSLCLVDVSDHGLVETMDAVLSAAPGVAVRERLCDVRDFARLSHVFDRERPELVIHAAALKYVHMGERHPGECVLTNLIGVRNAIEALRANGGGRFVLISTDKAASPTSVMGASKRLAELYVRDVAAAQNGVQAIAVRFGNVFGTRGSVVPIFMEQIRRGAPVTVTHPDMERYFMLLEEAVDLILQAAGTDHGPDQGLSPVLLLDMGEPLRIKDLAERMVKTLTPAGRPPSGVVFTGLKEGEKLSEQLQDEHEVRLPFHVDGLWRLQPVALARALSEADLAALETTARTGSDAVVRQKVFALLDQVLLPQDQAAAG
ncbi:MAG: polysaccharide biosynthesis protein [Alphaproteobacteria bacterium]|nr:polysaccharide biosynthesis protein [Alphaproteobacteria bacterium]